MEEASGSPAWWVWLNGADVVHSEVDAGPVLDVGCGAGDQMLRVRDRGFEVQGLDGDAGAIERARSLGLDAWVADIRTAELSLLHYSWVVMSHVLEHLDDPVAVLRTCRDALRRQGKILIIVPDANSPWRGTFGQWWHGWDPPFHLNHFTRRTLRKTLEAAGFHVEKLKSRGHVEDVARSLAVKSGQQKRRLLLRVSLVPLAWLLTWIGRGSYLVAVASREDDVIS